ncbi:MAG: hypothetical protein HY716_13225 [Planctomycetes bacterium]|nr:hypothetical protein [Planctomycetota bacterium]
MDIETDVDTFLAGEADRMRVVAFAMRGLARDTGDALEPKVLHASAGEWWPSRGGFWSRR